MTLFCVIIPLDCSSAKGGQILLGQAMHSHQMDVSILLPLELFATHVAGAMHVQLHVSVKLEKIQMNILCWSCDLDTWYCFAKVFSQPSLAHL